MAPLSDMSSSSKETGWITVQQGKTLYLQKNHKCLDERQLPPLHEDSKNLHIMPKRVFSRENSHGSK